jgi:hypothetical protein
VPSAVPFGLVFVVRLLAPIRGAHSSDSRSMSISSSYQCTRVSTPLASGSPRA